MPIGEAQPVRDVREALRRYLRDYPDAADTLIGIRQWWLPECLRDVSIEPVRIALADLIASDEVQCNTLPDGRELYSRGPSARSAE